MHQLKNRFLVSQIRHEVKQKKSGSQADPQTPRTPMTPMRLTGKFTLTKTFKTDEYFILLISQRPIVKIDEVAVVSDDACLTSKEIPKDIDFNTIYFYEYEKEGDISTCKLNVKISSIERVLIGKDVY